MPRRGVYSITISQSDRILNEAIALTDIAHAQCDRCLKRDGDLDQGFLLVTTPHR
jgi:hypothetical protein